MTKLKSISKSWLLGLALLLPLVVALPASAASSNTGTSSGQPQITRAYSTSQSLQNGMIVGINPASPNLVEALSAKNISQMQGVVVPASSAPVTLSGDGNTSQVYVATLGRYNVLVSDQNGPIKIGDYITISSIAGIGMSADGSQQLVVGKAASSFSGGQATLGREKLSGGQIAHIGLVSVDLGIAHNPLQSASQGENAGTRFLLNLSSSVSGKSVSTARTYAALAVFVIVALIAASVLYAGVRGDMAAVGRNPLARAAIGRSLFEVTLSAIVIFIIGLGAIYLILKI